jgi:hypothetical protein
MWARLDDTLVELLLFGAPLRLSVNLMPLIVFGPVLRVSLAGVN